MLSDSDIDTARRTNNELEKIVSELQLHQQELTLKNRELLRENEALNKSKEFYKRLYNLSPIGYVILDIEGIIQHASPNAASLLNSSGEALLNKKLATFISSADQDIFYFFIHGVVTPQNNKGLYLRLKQPPKPADYPQECPGIHLADCSLESCDLNNSITYVECRRSIYFDSDNQLRICLAVDDITEQKYIQESIGCLNRKLEDKLVKQAGELIEINLSLTKKIEELKRSQYQFQEREVKLNAIFNSTAEGIITIDRAGIIVSVNVAVETIFGFSSEELIGCSINKIIPVSRSKAHNSPKSLQSLMPNVIGKTREVEGVRKNGTFVSLELSVAEFSIDGAGYYTSLVRDVSLRKLKERQDKEHLDELAHVTRLGLMGEMASGIAHEVNQPLTAIVGYTMASLNFIQSEKLDKERLKEILHKTHGQAVRAGQIIQRMRDFVKPKTIHRSTVDINELILESMSLCSSDLKNNNITQKLELIKNIPMVHVDSVQIEQVLINLIRNGIEVLKKLPQTVRKQLTVQTYLNKDDYLEIRIKDNGSGIPEAEQSKIFTPFYTTKSDGMGMGLSISQSIIKSHQGDMYFNSLFGKGTTFYFTLPIQRKANGS